MQLPLLLSPLLNLSRERTPGFLATAAASDHPCPLLGEIYPPPTALASSPLWEDTVATLKDTLSSWPGLEGNATSYAIQIMSVYDDSPIFEHYNKAPHHIHGEDGTATVTGDTVFRIASTSKMFTVYALLVKSGFSCFEDPISKYIPEFANRQVVDSIANVNWDEVTVGALASQLSGITRDYALGDISTWPFFAPGSEMAKEIGLPDIEDLDPSQIPSCGSLPDQSPCNREETLRLMLKHPPSYPTWYTPSYSNVAFQLLGYVIENITGQTYGDFLNEAVFQPLNLKRTTTNLPQKSADAIRIPNDEMYDWDLGDDTASGGIYASTSDLTAHARAVLGHTQLTPNQVRRWLMPHRHTSLLQNSVGAPWEIQRVTGISKHHTVDIYTKSGNLITYTTIYGLIPDLKVGFAINALAEPSETNARILQTILQPALMSLYKVAKQEALDRFGGTYVLDKAGSKSTLTVTGDDEIGLVLSEWISNGVDMLGTLAFFVGVDSIRLFPTALSSRHRATGDHGEQIEKIAFRAVINLPEMRCLTWEYTDMLKYAGIGLDLLVFEIPESASSGRAAAIELPAMKVTYRRIDSSHR